MRPEEEKLRVLLEEIEDELKNSIGSGFRLTVGGRRMRGRLTELWALVSALKAARDRELSAGGTVEWAVVDEEAFGQIAQVRCGHLARCISTPMLTHWGVSDITRAADWIVASD
jgi:nuclear pore complex protein Nup54